MFGAWECALQFHTSHMNYSQFPEVVIITGASAGVGRATALAFASKGAALGLIARNEARLKSLQEEITAMGGRASFFIADVSQAAELEKAWDN